MIYIFGKVGVDTQFSVNPTETLKNLGFTRVEPGAPLDDSQELYQCLRRGGDLQLSCVPNLHSIEVPINVGHVSGSTVELYVKH